MTRLITEWIENIERQLEDYDRRLQKMTGFGLLGLAAASCGFSEKAMEKRVAGKRAAVIPITAGEGTIDSFSETLAAVARKMGLSAEVTKGTDVDGFYEAVLRGSDVLLMADDDRFICYDVRTGYMAENNHATALGYVTALDKMAEGIYDKEVLIVGLGPVGMEALALLRQQGTKVTVYDRDHKKMKVASSHPGVKAIDDISGIKRFTYIFDATNEGGWLTDELLAPEVMISAPGIPLSLSSGVWEKRGDRVVHDPIQIGTAVMIGLCFAR